MAVQAGMATTKLLVLIGAGVTGTVLMKEGKLVDFVKDISKVFSKHFKEGEKNNGEDMAAVIRNLSNELRQMASSRNITVVNSGGSQSGSLSSLAMPAVVIGIAGYGYFWWKGWKFTDVMYVTRRNMANVVASVSKQLEQVQAAVSATKRHLTSRIDNVSKQLDESVSVQGVIKNEVFEIREDIARVGGDIGTVQDIVESLGLQLDSVQAKQDVTNKGIILLCQMAQRWEGNRLVAGSSSTLSLQNGDSSRPGLPAPAPNSPNARLERSVTAPSATGLKELQSISEALSSNTGTNVRRTFTPTMSFGLQRS